VIPTLGKTVNIATVNMLFGVIVNNTIKTKANDKINADSTFKIILITLIFLNK